MYPITQYYSVPKLSSESKKRYTHRLWFIAKQKPKSETELQQAIKWSIVEASITFDQARYHSEIVEMVKRMSLTTSMII